MCHINKYCGIVIYCQFGLRGLFFLLYKKRVMIRFGYACNNLELGGQNIRTGRTMIERKFKIGGLQLASDIALANAKDLLTILKWNEANGITIISHWISELFPRWNHYRLEDLPGIDKIAGYLREAGDFVKTHDHRVTTHPGISYPR
jgi:UV DNA damage endonuclease